jgi:hypothetical protein
MAYSNYKHKYGKKIVKLNKIKPFDYSNYQEPEDVWYDYETLDISAPNYPFDYALKFNQNDPIRVERCRLIHGYTLHQSFRDAIIEPNNIYFEFLLDCFQHKCFALPTGGDQYTTIVKLITRFNNFELLQLVCDFLLKSNKLSMLNGPTQNDFQFISFEYSLTDRKYRGTCVHEAVFTNSLECLKILLEYGADLDVLDSNDMYPWEIRCFMGCYWTYKTLKIEILLLKNTSNLPGNCELLEKFENFLIDFKEINDEKECDDARKDGHYNKLLDYFIFLIKNDEYHSLKHYCRNNLRNQRICWNEKFENKKVILDKEKQFFF